MQTMPYSVPLQKQVRVIIDTDCACEADDQFALVHHLLSEKCEVMAINAVHYADRFGKDSEQESYREIEHVLALLALPKCPPVLHGSAAAMSTPETAVDSPAAQNIIAEARKHDSRPLFIAVQGAATNVASALLLAPDIAPRLTVVWIGGGSYPVGEAEFNVENDLHAANYLLQSRVPLWQVPKNVYSSMTVPFSVLWQKVAPYGAVGQYLFDRVRQTQTLFLEWIQHPGYTAGEVAASYPSGEMWILGDQPAVGLILFDQRYRYRTICAQQIAPDGRYLPASDETRMIRVYESIDRDFILDDFYAKLAFHCTQQ